MAGEGAPRTTSLAEVLTTHAKLVNAEIERLLLEADPRRRGFGDEMARYLRFGGERIRPSFAVFAPMKHVVEAGGKRVRPTLCLLACEAVGGRVERALPVAVGIEFLHAFTLVHDDVMDNALVRRTKPTVGAIWGDAVAITAGDGLFALALKAMLLSKDRGVPLPTVVRVAGMAVDTSLLLAQGQMMDLLFARSADVSIDEYMEMIRLKTGVLLEFSLRAGALVGGADDAQVEALARFGAPIGMAFQIRDDVLDVTADEANLGKPVGGDIREGKRTLLVAHALAHSPRRDRLLAILDRRGECTDAQVQEAIGILRDAGSIAYAQGVARDLLAEAKEALAEVPKGSGTLEHLAQIADYIIGRER
ncbi:MAG TPA: polyprenyl synthetase family protein [Candidatus Thermoplasmatota archaeon]|nr:polyprenyl synthetase family protein [Candidatus Thermoplasmatota archaeon]